MRYVANEVCHDCLTNREITRGRMWARFTAATTDRPSLIQCFVSIYSIGGRARHMPSVNRRLLWRDLIAVNAAEPVLRGATFFFSHFCQILRMPPHALFAFAVFHFPLRSAMTHSSFAVFVCLVTPRADGRCRNGRIEAAL